MRSNWFWICAGLATLALLYRYWLAMPKNQQYVYVPSSAQAIKVNGIDVRRSWLGALRLQCDVWLRFGFRDGSYQCEAELQVMCSNQEKYLYLGRNSRAQGQGEGVIWRSLRCTPL